MTTSTQQTASGQVTTITMILANGAAPPTQVHLPDATTIKPAADGSIQVDAKFAAALLGAGWGFKMSGTSNVPAI